MSAWTRLIRDSWASHVLALMQPTTRPLEDQAPYGALSAASCVAARSDCRLKGIFRA